MKNMNKFLLFLFLLINSISAQNSPSWLTLNGQQPVVIARGGFSGLYPESVDNANKLAISTGLADVIVSCNVQLTKDNLGICAPDIRIDNSTTIEHVTKEPKKSHSIYGKKIVGWFTVDFPFRFLYESVSMVQNVLSRTSVYDAIYGMSDALDVFEAKPSKLWLHFQYDLFYTQNKLSIARYLEDTMKDVVIDYISCPEIGFFKNMQEKLNRPKIKLIFQFPEDINTIEPSTNQTYSSILKNLAEIKSFATGILVPKGYIWTVNADGYLNASTTLVMDAHKEGLEVYASGFANDFLSSYNYSYDPTTEYLQFIDNSKFSVDGLLTDFPPTASETIACLARNKNSAHRQGHALVISKNGASGVYPSCTDLAYQQAVDDGADIIDCSVQMSKDGIAFCLDTADLAGSTTVMTSPFITRASTVPEIKSGSSIYSFDLTWTEIQSLKPEITSPYAKFGLPRNPAFRNAGKFLTLSEFLDLAKKQAVTGVLINIENAAYLASRGIDIIDSITTALTTATFDKQLTQKVLIQSDDTSVLSKFKNISTYKTVWKINEAISDVPKPTLDEIKKYADTVDLRRRSIIPDIEGFTANATNVVKELQEANLSVHVSGFRNEFMNIAFDFFSDPLMELAAYIEGIGVDGVDGVVTEFPATANKYLRSPCSDAKAKLPYRTIVTKPGDLYEAIPPETRPPANAPAPPLKVTDIVDPPMPAVGKANRSSSSSPGPGAAPSVPSSASLSSLMNVANMSFSLMTVLLFHFLNM